ncbi:hypothetical protein EV1_043826 [Malus domestica]|uniref:heat shock 70 kDa protein BIP3-like isoform X1 n=1 Tax=Malus domestica TaxID=3750 RepID=UPI003976A8D3
MKSVPSTLALLLFFVSAITILALALALGEDDVVIGIDLGSDYACVGVYINNNNNNNNNNSGRVEIIPNEQGNTATPSWVAFTDYDDDTGPLIGEAAKDQASLNAQRTIFHVKRLIGRKYDDPEVQRDINLLPYEVVYKDGKPCIQVKVRNKTKVFSPEEISAMILAKLKENAEAYLGKKIKHAVVTVPAYFTDAQRQATTSASNIAGLNVVKILDETTAAATAYGLDNKEQKNILVYHLGGGVGGGKIDDVNILTINNGVFELKGATSTGDSHMRGKDSFGVLRMMGSVIKLFKRKYNNNNNNEEKIKALEPIKKALEDAGINKTDIHEIVLVGGTSRIPKVQQLLKDFFNGKEPKKKGINPIEAVAFGAAVEGGVLFRLREGEGGDETKFKDQLFLDNTDPFRLLIKMNVGLMTKLVSKGAIFTPINESRTLSTYPDPKTLVSIKVFEGERSIRKDYHELFRTAPLRSWGVHESIKSSTLADANGTQHVKAEENKVGKAKRSLLIPIGIVKKEPGELAVLDEELSKTMYARFKLQNFIYSMRSAFKLIDKMDLYDMINYDCKLIQALEWLLHDSQIMNAEKDDFDKKLMEVARVCFQVIKQFVEKSGGTSSPTL